MKVLILIDSFKIDYLKSTNKILFPDTLLPITCNRDSSEVTVSGGLNYIWSGGNSPLKPTNVFTIPGIYPITMIDSNYCEVKDSIEIKKTNDSNLTVHFQQKSGQNKITCSNKEVEVEVLETGTYSWTGGSNLSGKTNGFSNQLMSFKIPLNSSSGSIYYTAENISFSQFIEITDEKFILNNLKIQVYDQFNNLLNNNGINWSFTLAFQY
jgi:hypothetical protein